MKMPRRIVFAIVGSMLYAASLCHAHQYVFSFEEKVRSADAIVVAEIKSVRKTILGYKYARFEPLEFIKGKSVASNVIRYGMPFYGAQEDDTRLSEGKKYVFFLRIEDSFYAIVGTSYGYYEIDGNESIKSEGEKLPVKEFIGRIQKQERSEAGAP